MTSPSQQHGHRGSTHPCPYSVCFSVASSQLSAPLRWVQGQALIHLGPLPWRKRPESHCSGGSGAPIPRCAQVLAGAVLLWPWQFGGALFWFSTAMLGCNLLPLHVPVWVFPDHFTWCGLLAMLRTVPGDRRLAERHGMPVQCMWRVLPWAGTSRSCPSGRGSLDSCLLSPLPRCVCCDILGVEGEMLGV